jgi:pyruvate,water dikinase
LRSRVLGAVIALTQQYTVYRENQRYHLDYLLTRQRGLALEYGRRLTGRGLLTDPTHAFLLRVAELHMLAGSDSVPDGLANALEERHAHWLRHRDHMPAVYLFDDVEVDASHVDDESDQVHDDGAIQGAPASRGRARGATKVVEDLSGLADVWPGDILVAKNIDPGWTSVFPIISGLITATGGVLSHGAILAREYGIPTVTSVKDATTLLPTGTIVELDGGVGTVRVLAADSVEMTSVLSGNRLERSD